MGWDERQTHNCENIADPLAGESANAELQMLWNGHGVRGLTSQNRATAAVGKFSQANLIIEFSDAGKIERALAVGSSALGGISNLIICVSDRL